ncbi:MAG: hypothetical protein AAGA80_10030 [Cyanobacteria bacterium P01_F01_bin.143]
MMSTNPADLVTPTSPEDCGLAIAIPLTEEEVRQDYEENMKHDYVRQQIKKFKNPQNIWEEIIKPISKVCSELVPVAEDLGIDVRTSATLKDLKDLFETRSVVTIVAHWRGSIIRPDDLLVPSSIFVNKILEESNPIASALRSSINNSDLISIQSNSASGESVEKLVKLLNKVIKLPSPLIDFSTDPMLKNQLLNVVLDDVSLAAMNRDVLDRWASEELRPGNRLELRDGLHSYHEVASIIPGKSKGIIDFALCNSIVLGNLLRKINPNWRVIMNSREVDPIPRLLLLKLLYEQLLREEYNYAKLLSKIHKKLLENSLSQ